MYYRNSYSKCTIVIAIVNVAIARWWIIVEF